MPVLSSSIDTRSETFRAQREQMLALVEQFRELEAKVRAHSAKKKGKFDERGQLLPRERVIQLLDRGSPFLELSTLAGYQMHDDDGKRSISGGSCVVGVGFVSGRRCLINASDSAIKGGATDPALRARCSYCPHYPMHAKVERALHPTRLFVRSRQRQPAQAQGAPSE